MAVGNQPTVAGINQSLTSFSVQMRNLMQQIADLNLAVSNLGLAGLEAVGFAAGDAQSVITQAAVLNTVSALYFGTATQATTFNFNNALSPLWGGN